MKILNVRFKNMNTLQGEWGLYFDHSPFKESGLFAITGPNGSGKSTIFDAISLGMYGEVVRQKHPSDQIISSAASDGYSMVTFAVNGNVFRSTWSLATNANSPMLPEMSLIELGDDEQILEQGVVNVRNRVAQLTGLDFKRFSRAVMLAQGEFAAFLNALDNERVDILENIVGRHMYASVLEDTARRLEKADNRLIELKEKIEDLPLMHASAVATLQETSRQLEEDFQATKRSLTRMQQERQQLADMKQLKNEYEENKAGLVQARQCKEQRQPDFLRLEKATAAASCAELLEQLEREKKHESENLIGLDRVNADIAGLKSRLDSLVELHDHLTLELTNEQQIWSERLTAIAGALEMDKALREENGLITQLEARRSSIKTEVKTKQEQRLALRQKISKNKDSLKGTESWLKKHADEQRLSGKILEIKDKLETLQALQNNLTANTTQRKNIQKIKRKALKLSKRTRRKLEKYRKTAQKKEQNHMRQQQALADLLGDDSLAALDRQLAEQKSKMTNCRAMLKIAKQYAKEGLSEDETLATELQAAEKRHDELHDLLQQEKTALSKSKNIARFEPYRKQLKQKDPCPLCGSLDHPYVDREPPFAKGSANVLREQEVKVGHIEQQIEMCAKKMAGIKRRHERLIEINKKWRLLSQSTDIQSRPGDRRAILERIDSTKRDRKNLRKRKRVARKQAQTLDKHYGSLQNILDEIAGKQLLVDNLQQDLHGHEQQLLLLEKELQDDRQKETDLRQNIRQGLAVFNLAMPKAGQEAKIIKKLEDMRMDYIDHQKRRAELSEQAIQLGSSNQRLERELEGLEKEVKDIDEQIHIKQDDFKSLKTKREAAFGSGNALVEQQAAEKIFQEKKEKQESTTQEIQQVSQRLSDQEEQRQAVEKTLADIRGRCRHVETQLLARIEPLGFATLKELEQSLLPSEQRQSLEEEKASIEHTIEQCMTNLDKIREKLGAEDPEKMVVESEADLSQLIQDTRERKDELQQELALVVARLEQQKALAEAYERMDQEMEQQEKIRDRLYEETCFFENAEDAEIRARVRETMLERLLEKSNRHLAALSGRYYLRRRATNGLELEIEDTFQGRRCRPVNTLSGGESFLVSIAMALGLSDISGNGRKIESLFIDEGFGYLDEETLYNVLATLKNLQHNRKTIGIISHIKMLENEIPTKIKISKLAGGVSRLDVVA